MLKSTYKFLYFIENSHPVLSQPSVMEAVPEVPEKAVQMQVMAPQQQEQQQQQQQPVMGTVAPGYARSYGQAGTSAVTLWSTSVCSCMDDVDSAVESFFCNRCQLSRQYNTITYGQNLIEPWTFIGSLAFDVLLGAPLTQFAFTWYIRNRVRARYQIAGDDLNDCLMAAFVPWCSAAQVYREMSLRAEWPAGCCINRMYSVVAPPTVPTMERDNTVAEV